MRAAPRPFCRAVLSTTIHSIFLFNSSSSGARNAPSSVPPWCAHSYRPDRESVNRDRVPNVGTGLAELEDLKDPNSALLLPVRRSFCINRQCTRWRHAMHITCDAYRRGREPPLLRLKPEAPGTLLAATAPACAPAAAPVDLTLCPLRLQRLQLLLRLRRYHWGLHWRAPMIFRGSFVTAPKEQAAGYVYGCLVLLYDTIRVVSQLATLTTVT